MKGREKWAAQQRQPYQFWVGRALLRRRLWFFWVGALLPRRLRLGKAG